MGQGLDLYTYSFGVIVMMVAGLAALVWLTTRARFKWADVRRFRVVFGVASALGFLGAGLVAWIGPRGPWPVGMAVGIGSLVMFLQAGRGSDR